MDTKSNKLNDFFDEHGLLAQGPPYRDGGDSLFYTSAYYFGIQARQHFGIDNSDYRQARGDVRFYQLVTNKLVDLFGLVRRHCDTGTAHAYWDRGSRDQTAMYICTEGLLNGNSHNIQIYVKRHRKRRFFLFATNTIPNGVHPPGHPEHIPFDWTPWKRLKFFFGWRPKNERGEKERVYGTKLPDFTLLDFWSREIRASRTWWLYPFLLVSDFEMAFSALFWRFGRKEDNDCLNTIVPLVSAHFIYPTPWTWFASQIIDWDEMQQKLMRYFRQDPAAITPLADFYAPITREMRLRYGLFR